MRVSRPARFVAPFLALAVGVTIPLRPPLAAAQPTPGAADRPALPSAEVSVEVLDAEGLPVADLPASGLSLRRAGELVPDFELGPESRPWRLVVYFDAALSAGPTLPRAAAALEALVPQLVALGEVEVVVATDLARTVQPATRDPARLAAALARLSVFERGEDRLVALRSAAGPSAESTDLAPPAQPASGPLAPAMVEAAFVADRLGLLLERLAESWRGEAEGPAAVFWVGDGYDLDPGAWQLGTADAAPVQPPARADDFAADAAPPLIAASSGPGSAAPGSHLVRAATAETARAVAALGWTVIPVTLRRPPGEDPSRWGVAPFELPSGDVTPLATVKVPRRRTAAERAAEEAAAAAPPPPVPVAPGEPLAVFATASGGSVVRGVAPLAAAVDRLAGRLRLRLPSGGDPLAEPVPLEVVAAAEGLLVTARRWTASPSPPALAAVRARRLLAGGLDPGRLTVQAVVTVAGGAGGTPEQSWLELQVEPPLATGPLRLTLATLDEEGLPRIEHRRVTGEVVRPDRDAVGAAAESGRLWTWRGAVDLPPTADRIAVLVEDRTSGSWGGTLAGVVDLGREAAGAWDAARGVLPGPRPVHLLRPEGAMFTGDVRFDAVVAPNVARVEFRLDGRPAAAATGAPFSAVLDLGRLPLPRRIEAVAFDTAGLELGRDEAVVNGGSGRLRVRFTEPASSRAVGPVTVAVEVEVPESRLLDRVELYWQGRRIASLFHPPFRHRLHVAADDPQGLLRAVVRTTDGAEAEDAVYLNGAGPAERLDVTLTELYVVVSGENGRPVRGLDAGDFVVREDGRRQEIATFGPATELPLTLGLALDSSASMFVKLPAVREAALGVLDDLVVGRDRAFLVDFDDHARLAAGPTRELGRLRRAARDLEPGGRTSLWEAVVFSLVQLQGAPGRRALLLYSDGADEDGDVGFDTALDFARRVGVPVYAIVANPEAVRLGGLGRGLLPSLGGRIERLAEATGGRAWVVRRGEDLDPYYAEIRAELAAQYRVGYYPDGGDDGSWRRVEVEVRRPGARARTVAGYRR